MALRKAPAPAKKSAVKKAPAKVAAPKRSTAKASGAKTTSTAKPLTKAPAAKRAAAKAGGSKTASAVKVVPGATLSLRQIAVGLAEAHEMTRRQTEEVLGAFVETIAKSLKKGAKIRINGLGILQVRHRAARMGRNPATGEQIQIKASKKIAFRPAKELKDSV
jgi:DNA-binding protein HU-beta